MSTMMQSRYEAYYAVSALLVQAQIYPSSHAGLKSMLGLHFVRTGKMSIEHGRVFFTQYANRQAGDYEDFVYCDKELFDLLRPKTIDFINKVQELIAENQDL
ncbi:MAG: hypothetical protein NC102_11075 [Clostridium sp.]|nr:hypothetical protein [Clostridium sp.]